MLSLALEPKDYVTINGDIIVTVSRVSKSRCYLAIQADRNVPIVRGEVLERGGTPPPPCLENFATPKRPQKKHGPSVRWTDDRVQAMLILEKIADRLERKGDGDEANVLRAQLRQISPDTLDC